MYDEATLKVLDLFTNPIFRKGFLEFFIKTQEEGIEAARKFWKLYADNSLMPDAENLYERMVDFYISLGFVPKNRYDEIARERRQLEEENRFLKETIREIQLRVLSEGGDKIRDLWEGTIDKQLEANRELSKNFYELFRLLKVGAD